MKFNPWHDVDIGKNTPKVVNAIIEIPKDSKIKYELDKETGLLRLDRFLYSAVHYPGDYGFVPKTLWYDNDPLDILILTSNAVHPLTLVKARVIGIIRLIDNGQKDDKLLAVYDNDPRFMEFQDVKDIPKHIVSELKNFFEIYKQLEGKECKILEILDKETAYEDIKISMEMYREKFN